MEVSSFLTTWLPANVIEIREGIIEKTALRELFCAECRQAGQPQLSDGEFTSAVRGLLPSVRLSKRKMPFGPRRLYFAGIALRIR